MAGVSPSTGPIQWEDAPSDEALLVGRVVSQVNYWERTLGKDFRPKVEQLYSQYRNFQHLESRFQHAQDRNDRDGVLLEARKVWGARLHIPISFQVIETMVPRAIANMPKLIVLPRDEQWRKNVETIRLLINLQQNQINIDLPLQDVMRDGHIYGLGVGKTYWLRKEKTRRKLERAVFPGAQPAEKGSGYALGPPKREVTFDDPMFEAVDLLDFMWDPFGSSMESCEWTMHRQWLSVEAILGRLAGDQPAWNTQSAAKLDEEKIRALGPNAGVNHYSEIWSHRLLASGFTSTNFNEHGEHPHEVLEFHNGDEVWTVLDRRVLVQNGENSTGEMPFQVYRPTPLNKQMVGIGDLEPIQHLQRELDTLRSQRRDSATMALNGAYAYDDGAINREDLVFGPNVAIPVTNARPQDALFPIPVHEVPATGYQEEQAIRGDVEGVSGLADALATQAGVGSPVATATQATLQSDSLSRRVQLAARRFEIEVVRNVCRQFLLLDQRHITEQRSALVVPGENLTYEQAVKSEVWKFFPVGPGELEGDYEIEPEGGSMAARNIPQDRSDAQGLMALAGHSWFINPTMPLLRALELYGIEHPQAWLRDPDPPVPGATLKLLETAGVDPNLIANAVRVARTVKAPQEGPDAQQQTEMMAGGSAPAPQAMAAAGAQQ